MEWISVAAPVSVGLKAATNMFCAPISELWKPPVFGRSLDCVLHPTQINPFDPTAIAWPLSVPLPPKNVEYFKVCVEFTHRTKASAAPLVPPTVACAAFTWGKLPDVV